MADYKINILHIYPDLLNLYGDKGNIECMRKRLEWRGIIANVSRCTMENPKIDFKHADIILLGGGLERELSIVLDRLKEKAEELKSFVESDGTMLAICGGYQILGKQCFIGESRTEGLGILDIVTDKNADDHRFTGDAVIECAGIPNAVVGFENHSEKTNIGNYTPLGKVIKGFGNDGTSGFEGVLYKNLIGTYLHGPLLPKNPKLCDKILEDALKNKYPDFKELTPLDDGVEELANEYMLKRMQ